MRLDGDCFNWSNSSKGQQCQDSSLLISREYLHFMLTNTELNANDLFGFTLPPHEDNP